MSELKAYRVKGVTIGDHDEVYNKPEADKVIARHKYKRCLAMARWCKSEQTYSSFSIYVTEHPKSRWASRSVPVGAWFVFWKNRELRWLKLADKFKEA